MRLRVPALRSRPRRGWASEGHRRRAGQGARLHGHLPLGPLGGPPGSSESSATRRGDSFSSRLEGRAARRSCRASGIAGIGGNGWHGAPSPCRPMSRAPVRHGRARAVDATDAGGCMIDAPRSSGGRCLRRALDLPSGAGAGPAATPGPGPRLPGGRMPSALRGRAGCGGRGAGLVTAAGRAVPSAVRRRSRPAPPISSRGGARRQSSRPSSRRLRGCRIGGTRPGDACRHACRAPPRTAQHSSETEGALPPIPLSSVRMARTTARTSWPASERGPVRWDGRTSWRPTRRPPPTAAPLRSGPGGSRRRETARRRQGRAGHRISGKAPWQPVGESNPSFQVENLAS